MEPISLYLHVPFCTHRCGYCDFNTYAGKEALIGAYAKALAEEVRYIGSSANEKILLKSIYFGGGTPSLMEIGDLGLVIRAIEESFEVDVLAEITLEVNPGTVDLAYMEGLRSLGFNRISMGVQSANPRELMILEREHGFLEAISAFMYARQAGFDNVSIDLIFGLPGQTLDDWKWNLELGLGMHSDHISLYGLTIEHGTPLEKMINRGLLQVPDQDLAADMYELTMEKLEGEGYVHYEISNWARKDQAGELMDSKHNGQYWLNNPYIGLGAGAHGYIEGYRTVNVLGPESYIKRLGEDVERKFPRTPATIRAELGDASSEIGNTMMMGLRLLEEGVSNQAFLTRFGKRLEEVFPEQIKKLIKLGLLEWKGGMNYNNLRLTKKGRILGNQVFVEFI